MKWIHFCRGLDGKGKKIKSRKRKRERERERGWWPRQVLIRNKMSVMRSLFPCMQIDVMWSFVLQWDVHRARGGHVHTHTHTLHTNKNRNAFTQFWSCTCKYRLKVTVTDVHKHARIHKVTYVNKLTWKAYVFDFKVERTARAMKGSFIRPGKMYTFGLRLTWRNNIHWEKQHRGRNWKQHG